jgi:low affinity Fe/Cu permease
VASPEIAAKHGSGDGNSRSGAEHQPAVAAAHFPGRLPMHDRFRRWAEHTAQAVGSPLAFTLALATIVVWALTGPYFKYSDTWQLVINTSTTIVTFLMVFLIQNTQNRETRIVSLKLDELLRGVEGARTGLVQLDHMTDKELEDVRQEFWRLRDKYAPLVDDDIAHVTAELEVRKLRE